MSGFEEYEDETPAYGEIEDEPHLPPPIEIAQDEAAILYTTAWSVLNRLTLAGMHEKPDGTPLPRGLLRAGEAMMLVTSCIALCASRFPDLNDPAVLQRSIHDAMLTHATGKVN